MMPAKHTKFASAIQLKSGETYYFCGTGCMIRTWMHPEVFLNVSTDKLDRCVVPEYFSGEHINGLSAFWVAGSDVVGPMGPALVPLKSGDDVDAFRKRHGGKVVFKMGELDDQRWEEITGKKAVP
jgi:nitrous oxide reductase accessory protein NosL